MSIEILRPIDGEIVNHHVGRATGDGSLQIEVAGRCAEGSEVTINNAAAEVRGGEFTATISITDFESNAHSIYDFWCCQLL